MSKFRIKKAGREFSAGRLETLQELVSQGLLGPDDPVSVDQGSFRPAREIEGLADLLAAAEPAEDPWRHWGAADQQLDGQDDVLTSFLDQLDSGSMPSVTGSHAKLRRSAVSLAAVAPVDPEPPEPEPVDPAALDPEPLPPQALDPSALSPASEEADPPALSPASEEADFSERSEAPEPFDPADLSPAPDDEDEPPSLPPASRTDPPPTFSHRQPPAARPPPDPDPSPEEESPVSFSEWIEKKGSEESGQLLENFGRYDNGVIVAARGHRELFNPWRIGLLVALGTTVILFGRCWVTTSASTQFPTEAELETRVPGGFRANIKPNLSIPVGAVDRRKAELAQRSAADRALRDSLQSKIIHFANREGLEDALFQELFNAKVTPLSVAVETLELRGGTELGEVPVRSDIVIKLAAPRGAEYGDEQFQHTLKVAWMLLGKYQSQGRIRFHGATVVVADPLPWDERYEGDRLLSLWNGQLQADALFLDNR